MSALFYFCPPTTTSESKFTEIEGTGIGLVVCKNLIELMNGTLLYVEDNPANLQLMSGPFINLRS
ncbi:MAG: hypothetical protein HQ503_16950 [Rhodospirillales bacterium]|nr:hypothetical protein [Rhodospirillales bacterium]